MSSKPLAVTKPIFHYPYPRGVVQRGAHLTGYHLGSVVLALLVVTCSAGAQDGDVDLREALDAERRKLEEQMMILQEQMSEYERQKKRLDDLESQFRASQVAEEQSETTGGGASVVTSTPIADDDELIASPSRIDIGANETRDDHVVLTAQDLIAQDFVGSWPMFGTDYRMKIGGYVKLDMLYDFDGAGDKTQFLISQIPVDGTPEAGRDGYFNMFARETRFNIDVRGGATDEPAQQLFIEMDFFDESSFSPRLRHAYVVYGNVLFGQTWTTIAEMSSIPFTIDFSGGDALFGTRTAQLRWQEQLDDSWNWAVALEQLQSPGIYNPNSLPGEANSAIPVLAGRLTHQRSNGVHTLAAQVQELAWDGNGLTPDASAVGWALVYAGRHNLKGGDFFTWNLAYGDGTPENIMALTGSQANAVLEPDGTLTTRQGYSVALGYGHKWSPTLASNVAYAYTDLENLGAASRAPDAIQEGGLGHINLVWTDNKLSTGIEFMWGRRVNSNGQDGDATRIQAMIKYGF